MSRRRRKNPGRRAVHSARFDRCLGEIRGVRNPYAACTASLGRRAFKRRRRNPTRREGYVFGTHHFVSLEDARRYFARLYGGGQFGVTVTDADVDRMVKDHRIAIGPPRVKRYEKLSIIPGEGRYQITRMRTVRYSRRRNPRRYVLVARKITGGKVLRYLGGRKFSERGRAKSFASATSAHKVLRALERKYHLEGYHLSVL